MSQNKITNFFKTASTIKLDTLKRIHENTEEKSVKGVQVGHFLGDSLLHDTTARSIYVLDS